MKKFKLSKKNYLLGFLIVTGVLALVRIIRPDVAGTHYSDQIDHSSLAAADSIGDEMVASNDGGVAETKESDATRLLASSDIPFALTNFFNPDGSERRTRVRGVGSYRECFPDSQMVQLQAAERHGVSAVLDRADAEKRKGELVYVGKRFWQRCCLWAWPWRWAGISCGTGRRGTWCCTVMWRSARWM